MQYFIMFYQINELLGDGLKRLIRNVVKLRFGGRIEILLLQLVKALYTAIILADEFKPRPIFIWVCVSNVS